MASIEDIECVLRAAELLSFHKVAEQLYKNPSQVSRTIRKFETEIGCEIFERTCKGLVVTDDGAKILEHCKSIMESYQAILSYAAQKRSTQAISGKISFYASSMITTGIFKSIGDFYSCYPNIEVVLRSVSSDSLPGIVAKSDDSIGYLSQIFEEDGSPFFRMDESLQIRPITARLRPYLICNSKNPILRMQKPFRWHVLRRSPSLITACMTTRLLLVRLFLRQWAPKLKDFDLLQPIFARCRI